MQLSDYLEKLAKGERMDSGAIADMRRLADDAQSVGTLFKSFIRPGTQQLNLLPVFDVIWQTQLESDVASQTIQIPSTFKHLIVIGSGRTTATPVNPTMQSLNFTFNGDTGTNYTWSDVYGSNTGPHAAAFDTQSNLPFGGYNTDNCTAGSASMFYTILPHYQGPFWKMCLSILAAQTIPGTPIEETDVFTGYWKNTAPITSMTVVPGGGMGGNLKAGSVLSVYGIR